MTLSPWQAAAPKNTTDLGGGVAYSWTCGAYERGDETHEHTIECLWVWHDCQQILGVDSIAPGARFGWRPSGHAAHTLVQIDPLTITASVYWPDCCGIHGFITNGSYQAV
jgi:hypothetical protein